jgi:hypothetical protein
MTTADWAIIVSFASLLIAVASFVWNVWSKFIYPKPKLRVSTYIMKFVGGSFEDGLRAVTVSVTNHGPLVANVTSIVAKTSDGKPKGTYASINPYSNFPYEHYGDGEGTLRALPKKIDVGEEAYFYFPADKSLFIDGKVCALGVRDSFGRINWAKSSDFIKLRNNLIDS